MEHPVSGEGLSTRQRNAIIFVIFLFSVTSLAGVLIKAMTLKKEIDNDPIAKTSAYIKALQYLPAGTILYVGLPENGCMKVSGDDIRLRCNYIGGQGKWLDEEIRMNPQVNYEVIGPPPRLSKWDRLIAKKYGVILPE